MAPLNGIDISGYQSNISNSTVNLSDVVIVKATEGAYFTSSSMVSQFMLGVNGNKKVGVYHFARPGSAKEQADYFYNTVTNAQLYPDFWCLDYEDSAIVSDESWALEFMDRVSELSGGDPVWFYTYVGPLKLYNYKSIRDKGIKHWIAGYPYGTQHGFGPKMSLDAYLTWAGVDSTGIDFAGWQYTSQGRLSGYSGDLDLDWFYDDAFTEGPPSKPNTSSDSGVMEKAIDWFKSLSGNVTYSMTDRDGPSSYDCSSAVYHSLISAGIMDKDHYIGNTETEFDDLTKYGFEKLEKNSSGGYDARRGDIFIWGDKGSSAGSFGHTGIFTSSDNIIHCNYGYNGITENNHDVIWAANGYPKVTIYRRSQEGDWLDMASYEDVKKAVREVIAEEFAQQGGKKGKTSLKTEAAWTAANFETVNTKLDNISAMAWLIMDRFRIGIPGIVQDGSFGPKARSEAGYGSDDEATNTGILEYRVKRFKEAKAAGFPWWK